MASKVSYQEFINRVHQKFGNNVDLSQVSEYDFDYTNTKYSFICKIHNKVRYTTPKLLLSRQTICSECAKENISRKSKSVDRTHLIKRKCLMVDSVIEKLSSYNNIRIIETSFIFTNNHTLNTKKSTLVLECSQHGIFTTTVFQLFDRLRRNKNINPCKICTKEQATQKLKQTAINKMTERFIKDAKLVHGSKYDYTLVDFSDKESSTDEIEIICPEHGVFRQVPKEHLKGKGCPICSAESLSPVQMRLISILESKYPDLTVQNEVHLDFMLKNMRFDIYIPELKLAIEYNGPQHFEKDTFYSSLKGSEYFNRQRELDIFKYEESKKHGITVIFFTFNKTNYNYFTTYYNNLKDLFETIDKTYTNKN